MVQSKLARAPSIGATRQYWLHIEGNFAGDAMYEALGHVQASQIHSERFDVTRGDTSTRISVLLDDVALFHVEALRIALRTSRGVERVYVVPAVRGAAGPRAPALRKIA